MLVAQLAQLFTWSNFSDVFKSESRHYSPGLIEVSSCSWLFYVIRTTAFNRNLKFARLFDLLKLEDSYV